MFRTPGPVRFETGEWEITASAATRLPFVCSRRRRRRRRRLALPLVCHCHCLSACRLSVSACLRACLPGSIHRQALTRDFPFGRTRNERRFPREPNGEQDSSALKSPACCYLLCVHAAYTAAVSTLFCTLHCMLAAMQASAKQRPRASLPSAAAADSTPSLMKTPLHGDCSDFTIHDCAPRRRGRQHRPDTQSAVLCEPAALALVFREDRTPGHASNERSPAIVAPLGHKHPSRFASGALCGPRRTFAPGETVGSGAQLKRVRM